MLLYLKFRGFLMIDKINKDIFLLRKFKKLSRKSKKADEQTQNLFWTIIFPIIAISSILIAILNINSDFIALIIISSILLLFSALLTFSLYGVSTLVNYLYKIESQQINLRLSRESLKPTINLKYNALAENQFENTFDTYNMNNYKWGAEVSFPLFIRKERGQVKLDKLKIRELEAGFAEKNQRVKYKVNSYKEYSELLKAQQKDYFMKYLMLLNRVYDGDGLDHFYEYYPY